MANEKFLILPPTFGISFLHVLSFPVLPLVYGYDASLANPPFSSINLYPLPPPGYAPPQPYAPDESQSITCCVDNSRTAVLLLVLIVFGILYFSTSSYSIDSSSL